MENKSAFDNNGFPIKQPRGVHSHAESKLAAADASLDMLSITQM